MSLLAERPEFEPRPPENTFSVYGEFSVVFEAIQAEKQRRGGDHLTIIEILSIDKQQTGSWIVDACQATDSSDSV